MRFIGGAAWRLAGTGPDGRGEASGGRVRDLARMSLVLRVELGVLRLLAVATIGGGLACPLIALAQGAPVVSQPVVQALPSPHTQRLNAALARLGRDPRDVAALVDAGDAARGLGDLDAAIGFYRRADEAAPGNARAKAGLATAYVLHGDPVSAIPYFDAAQKAGAPVHEIAADRGLAYDLVGDNATAQRHYAVALAAGGDGEARIRLAISQAMAGDQKAAEATLMPLLRQQDKPAWRARAFTLAIAGDTREAVDVAQSILPARLAENIAPYLRYMPRLTRAQQAAAANLGRFPRASEIGRDDPRIAAYAPPRLAAADTALVPKGEPLDGGSGRRTKGASSRTRVAKAERTTAVPAAPPRKVALAPADSDRVAPPEPRPAIESNGELPPLKPAATPSPAAPAPVAASTQVAAASAQPAPVSRPEPELPPARTTVALAAAPTSSVPQSTPAPAFAASPQAVPPANPPAPNPPAVTAPAAKPPAPGFDLASLPPTGMPATEAPRSVAPAAPSPAALPSVSLAEVFADLGKPAVQAVPVSGAVDITRIEPARPEPKPAPKPEPEKPVEKAKPKPPPPPAHPSRIWVQVGVGRDKSAIAFDWRRYGRQAPALFKGRQPQISDMGRTNRILAGPFETQKAANDFVAELKKAGIEGALPWTSPAGQVVDKLPAK